MIFRLRSKVCNVEIASVKKLQFSFGNVLLGNEMFASELLQQKGHLVA